MRIQNAGTEVVEAKAGAVSAIFFFFSSLVDVTECNPCFYSLLPHAIYLHCSFKKVVVKFVDFLRIFALMVIANNSL